MDARPRGSGNPWEESSARTSGIVSGCGSPSVLRGAVFLEILPALPGHEDEPGDVEGDEELPADEGPDGDAAAAEEGDPGGDHEGGAVRQKDAEEAAGGVAAVERRD